MATDSKMTAGDFFVTRCDKVFRLKHGHLAGFSGDADERDIKRLLDKVKTVDDLPSRTELQELEQEFNVLLVLTDGRIFYISAIMETELSEVRFFAQVTECKEPYAAVGNGSQFALGALFWGHTAAEAVEAACHHDGCSGPPIKTFELKPKRIAAKSKKR